MGESARGDNGNKGGGKLPDRFFDAAIGLLQQVRDEDAEDIAAAGAAALLARSGEEPSELRRQVTSPGGTTIAGIALGIGVLLAIQLAAAAAQRGFEHGVENLAGRAALEITQAPMGIDERRLPELAWLQELGQVTPIIEGTVVYTAADGMSQVLTVFGIDILTDAAFRDYAFAAFADGARADVANTSGNAGATERSTRDILSLLGDIDGIVLTETFAQEHGIKAGDTITLSTADGRPLSRGTGWFPEERFREFPAAFVETGSTTEALRRYGVEDYARGSTRISARHATIDEAQEALDFVRKSGSS